MASVRLMFMFALCFVNVMSFDRAVAGSEKDSSAAITDENDKYLEQLQKRLRTTEFKAVPRSKVVHDFTVHDLTGLPVNGVVQNQEAAIIVGEIFLKAQYGEKTVNGMKPLEAELIDDKIWVVHRKFVYNPKAVQLGDHYVGIQKNDGHVTGFYIEK
jgi:hypothetical protein